MTITDEREETTTLQRYVQLAVLVVVGGAIYPLIYLRQNFEITILDSFGMTASQLGQCYAMLGVLFVVTYIPSGWLADRVAPRLLMSFSLALAGVLGIWFSTMPNYETVRIIFAGWGIATGLTFWAALIKATAVLAKPSEQGRFFGILDGGRGLVEALLATVAVGMFAYWLESLGQDPAIALRKVIWFYVAFMLVMSPIVLFIVEDNRRNHDAGEASSAASSNFLDDLKTIATRPEIWLAAVCIHYGLSAVAVGSITVAKLWMRPIGAAAAGFAGDFLDRELVLGILLLLGSVVLAGLVVLPTTAGTILLLALVLIIGILTYAVRGIYWATLESCKVPNRVKGLAIGAISLLGYSPDIYLPLINGVLLETFPGKLGYSIYFSGIAIAGVFGAFAAWRLKVIVAARDA
jgi:sugar phosphate permease